MRRDSVEFFSDDVFLWLWNYMSEADTLHRVDLTPLGGAGTGADPQVLRSTRIALTASGIPPVALTYKLDYIREWRRHDPAGRDDEMVGDQGRSAARRSGVCEWIRWTLAPYPCRGLRIRTQTVGRNKRSALRQIRPSPAAPVVGATRAGGMQHAQGRNAWASHR